MRERIVAFVRWLARVTGSLARRVIGAVVVGTIVFWLLLLLLLLLVSTKAVLADSGLLAQLLFIVTSLVGGTFVAALAGFIFPGPVLAIMNALHWLPSEGGGDGGGGSGLLGLFDSDD